MFVFFFYRRHIMFIFRFIILFWVTARVAFHALLLKNTSVLSCFDIVFHTVLVLCLFLAPLSLRPSLPKYTMQFWLVSSHMPDPVLRTTTSEQLSYIHFLYAKLAVMHTFMQMCDMVTWCDVMKSQTQRQDYWRGVSGAVFSVGQRMFCWCRLWL